MNSSIRRATPDSEAIASSEDERPWPAAPSFGSLPHNEGSVPGLGGGIWSTQKRGSFKMEKTAQRNAAREARLGAPGQPRSGLRNDATPSPSASEGSAALPFSIPLHPAPKAGRSLSHSHGQREYPPVTSALSTQRDHAAALPLSLLAEEVDTESESELGGGLTQTTSHPPIGTLHRTATFPATYSSYYAAPNGKDHGETAGGGQGGDRGDRLFEGGFANLSLASEQPQRRSQWQTHLGWDDVPNVNESRRHSLADIPTRRGSLVGGTEHRNLAAGQYWPDGRAYDWEGGHHAYNEQQYRDTATHQHLEYGPPGSKSTAEHVNEMLSRQFAELRAQEEANTLPNTLPSSYRVSQITLPDSERARHSMNTPPGAMASATGQQFNATNRPRKQLFIVSFKCSRVDVFYLLDNTGLAIKEGDIVIVEADRGQDLGTVQHANVTPDEARNYKRRYGEEQYKWLMMFSKNNNQGSVNPNAQVYGDQNRTPHHSGPAHSSGSMPQGMQANYNNLKPKAIKRLANQHEIRLLGEKEGNEAKAKRTCQNKVSTLHLDMEILDAEWQWDFQKLIFYYYADHYINFKDLITELYRIYKTRIWLSAINPASFSQHAPGSLPSGIGPGALTAADREAFYAAGTDPDPYGAIPPYAVGYQTYTPNYPGIPGVTNSFANPMASPFQMPPQGFQAPNPQQMQPSNFGSGSAPPQGFQAQNPQQMQSPNFGSGSATPSGEMQMPWRGDVDNYSAYANTYGMNWGPQYKPGGVAGLHPATGSNVWQGGLSSGAIPHGPELYSNISQFGQHPPEGLGWEFRSGKLRPGRPPGAQKGRETTQPESALTKAVASDPFGTMSLGQTLDYPTLLGASNASYRPRFNGRPEENAKAVQIGRYLDSLQNEEDTRADEMSRER